jgi:ClpP class serine protease
LFEQDAQIRGQDVAFIAELLNDVGGSPIDLLIQTPGGETAATEAIISVLQNTVSDFRAIVPNAAKSNGTLLCLAA